MAGPRWLSVRSGSRRGLSDDYLWTEVLHGLDVRSLRRLAVAAAIGGGDWELLSAVLGEGVRSSDVVSVPLARVETDGWWPHDLWTEHLDGVVENSDVARARSIAARCWFDRGNLISAFRLAIAAANAELVQEIVGFAFETVPPRVGRDVMLSWVAELRRAMPDSYLLTFFEAKRAIDERDYGRVPELARKAVSEARAAGDAAVERNAIVDAALGAFSGGDVSLLSDLVARAFELAEQGVPEAAALLSNGQGLLAEGRGDVDGAVAAFLSYGPRTPPWLVNASVYSAARTLVTAARFVEARTTAERFVHVPNAEPASEVDVRFLIALGCGAYDEAERYLGTGLAIAERLNFRQRTVSQMQKFDVLRVLSGRALRVHVPESVLATERTEGELAVVRALEAAERGDTSEAAEHARRAVFFAGSSDQGLRRPLSVLRHVAGDDNRVNGCEREDACLEDLGGELVGARPLVRALRQLALGGDVDADLVSGEAASISMFARALLVPRWRSQLAVAVKRHRRDALALNLLHEAGPGGARAVADLVEHPAPAVAKAAASMMESVPMLPERPIRLQLFGGATVTHGDAVSSDPHLRRARVQALLGYLAVNGPVRRDALIADLWSDRPERDARNNFRVTLSYATRVLEPQRQKGSASFAIVQRFGTIDLVDHERLVVDARQLLRSRNQALAAEARLDLEAAGMHHATAVACAGGDFLPGVGDDEWLVRARDRFRLAACASAVRAAELAIAAGRNDDGLLLASRAVELDSFAEDARRTLIGALLASGDRMGARAAFRELLVLLADLGSEPEASTTMLGLRLASP